jgi:hypothetical protein
VDKNLATGEQPKLFDRWFEMVEGTEAIIELTTNEVKEQGYGMAPDYEMVSRIALDRNPHFGTTYKFFDSEAIAGVLARAPFMIILIGIIGTFAGFYLALATGGDIKAGAAVARNTSILCFRTRIATSGRSTPIRSRWSYCSITNRSFSASARTAGKRIDCRASIKRETTILHGRPGDLTSA